jgi:dGTP triphosphohydrolase
MVAAVRTAFIENFTAIEDLSFSQALVKASKAAALCKALKKLGFKRAYKSRGVLEVELRGDRTIHALMDMLWKSILSQDEPFEKYIYFSRISENYRLLLSDPPELPEQLHLLCDMVAGMTDSFACSLETELVQLSPTFNGIAGV